MPLGIKIPGNGPGVGPIIPPALYDLGVDDWVHRWSAERLGAVDSAITSWPDAAFSAIPLANASSVWTVATESGAKYAKKAVGVTSSLSGPGVLPSTGPFTIMAIARMDPGNLVSTTRAFITFQTAYIQRASNGSYGVSGTGANAAAGGSTNNWVCIGLATNGGNLSTGTFSFKRDSSVQSTMTNSLTVTNATTLSLSVSVSTVECNVAEIITWDRRLSDAEMETVRTAMIANSPLL